MSELFAPAATPAALAANAAAMTSPVVGIVIMASLLLEKMHAACAWLSRAIAGRLRRRARSRDPWPARAHDRGTPRARSCDRRTRSRPPRARRRDPDPRSQQRDRS